MRLKFSLVGLAGCAFDWMLTRPWKRLTLYFLPLLLALSTLGLAGAGNLLNRNSLTEKYLQVANQEVKEWEDQWKVKSEPEEAAASSKPIEPPKVKEVPASAEMLFRRVQQLQKNDSRSMFFVALCYLQRGATSQGLNMLNRLAPVDRVGYPAAHAYLAEQMLSKPLRIEDVPTVRHHAEAAMRWEGVSPQLLAMISGLFVKLNELGTAVKAMEQAAKIDSKYYLLLAELAKRDNKNARLSEESLEKGAQSFTEKLEKNPQDIGARLMLADAQRIASNFTAAEQTLLDGTKLTGNPIFKSALSELYCQVFVKTAEFKEDSWTGDIELLEKAFRLDPNNLHIFEQVARLARFSGKNENVELMRQLHDNLVAGRATSVTHMWIAEHYLNTNEFAKAVPHLEQAVKRDPTSSRCWNNLAYVLADLDPTRLDEALVDVDRAIALTPQMPDYYDTRGTILMKLKKPADAIAAFEKAIEAIARTNGALPPQPAYHERLAEAYTAVGDQAMADSHKKFAARLVQARDKAIADARAKSAAAENTSATQQGKAPEGKAPEGKAPEGKAPESPDNSATHAEAEGQQPKP